MHKMKFASAQLEGRKPIAPGIYKLRLIGFDPKLSNKGDSINLNPIFEYIGGERDGQQLKYGFNGNSKIPSFIQDMVHSLGHEMEDQEGEEPSVPGSWDGDKSKFEEDKPETWVYYGPLLNETCQVELGVKEYQGKENNVIKRFICDVDNCAERFPKVRHSDNIAGK